MGTWTVIGDFERVYRGPELTYRGWQRASNTTPDELFADLLATGLTPAASRSKLIAHIREFFPEADSKVLERLF